MLRRAMLLGWCALAIACTGAGIDRSDAVPVRATLSIRPVADGEAWPERMARVAGQTAGLEVEATTIQSRRLPPVPAYRIRAPTKAALQALVRSTGQIPVKLQVGYERESEGRWWALVVRTDQGLVLGDDTRVKLSHEPDGESLFLLLGSDDASAFERLTIEHDGRRLAIMDGNEVLLAPT
ncbi:MAG: hypothetical protein KDK70_42405, partial [Myxococcales bacterium]|nr:hypothetical protein [Myxococcales bacterium]